MAELSVVPLGLGESVSAEVAAVLDVIDRSGLTYRLTPMGTILEGAWEQVMAVVGACYEVARARAPRVYIVLKLDCREGDGSRLAAKVEAVERHLGRQVSALR